MWNSSQLGERPVPHTGMLETLRRKLACWLAGGVGLERVEQLEKQLSAMASQESMNAETIHQLRHELAQLQAALAKEFVDTKKASKQAMLDTASFAASATLSEEGLIENTLQDPSRIQVDENSYVRGRLLTYGHGGQIKIGKWCYVGVRTEIWSMESIVIGDRVLISHDVNIHDGTAHSANAKERHHHYKTILTKGHPKHIDELPGVKSAPIIIEDDAWISFGATILRGVRIGAGSVISAGAIVTNDVPPGVIYQCEIKPTTRPLNP